MTYRDYYGVLGVGKSADGTEIKRAYRRLARRHHPDLNPGDHGAAERFKEISEAYEVLSDPERRRRYDHLGADWRRYRPSFDPGAGPGRSGPDLSGFSTFFEHFFGGGSPFGRRGPGPGRTAGRGWPASGPGFRAPGQAPGQIHASVEIRLEEALSGVVRELADGTGGSFRVRIPAGVRDGARLRVRTPDGRQAILEVRIAEHPQFRRRGDNLETSASVGFAEAALGGEITVPTLDGPARIRIPAGISSETALRVAGRGMPAEPGRRGDLIVRVRIVAPKGLSAEEKEVLSRFSRPAAD